MIVKNGVQVFGHVAKGFEPVARAFARNFERRLEIGAAFAAVQDGEVVVDIWAGWADKAARRPWTQDSLQLVFSSTKGAVATTILKLIDGGALDIDKPVSHYWPEFGKSEILVRHAVSHQSRMPGIETPLKSSDLLNTRYITDLLERQLPSVDARAEHCYHPLTFGWICGELVRRISGQTIGQFFAHEIAEPLGLEIWIGLPDRYEARVTKCELAPGWGIAPYLDPAVWARDPLTQSIWGNPSLFALDSFPWNDRAWHASEVPGVNAIGTAKSFALLYACLASGGSPILRPATVALGTSLLHAWTDEVHRSRRLAGVGFLLQDDLHMFAGPHDAFGHDGAGGSIQGAWPTYKLGFSYVMNLLRDPTIRPDRRAHETLNALEAVVASRAR